MISADRSRAHEIVRARGWNGTSFQVLGEGYAYHFDGDAFVAYVDTGSAWVAAGAPVVARERLAEVAESFRVAAERAGRTACFFGAGARFVQEAPSWNTITIGAQPIWRTTRWSEHAKSARSISAQVRRARAKGVTIRRLDPSELVAGSSMRSAIEALVHGWLASRRMPPMGFLVDVQPFHFVDERRTFVAERGGDLVGVLSAAPIYARRGWLVETLARHEHAPNGTTEALIDAAIRTAESESVEIVTLGMAPLTGANVPLRLRFARWLTRPFYDFAGLHAFRTKLRPDEWETLYLTVPPRSSGAAGWLALVESLRAFARGSILRFALRSAVHLAARTARLPKLPERGTLGG